MLSKLSVVRKALLFFVMVCAVFISVPGHADESDALKPLLGDIKGWDAEEPEGMSMDMGGVKMVNAIRTYSKGGNTIDVTIIVGSNAMVQDPTQPVEVETSEAKMNVSEIDGFSVFNTFIKEEKKGHIVVNLMKKQTEASLFIFNYSGISPEEALKIAKKFDWEKIKIITSNMVD